MTTMMMMMMKRREVMIDFFYDSRERANSRASESSRLDDNGGLNE